MGDFDGCKYSILRYNELMDEISRYAVGLDIGTANVRAVVATVSGNGGLSVVGYGEAANSGMRRGLVVNLSGPTQAIDQVLNGAEQMSGCNVKSVTASVNGASIISTRTEGMIAVGAVEHEINDGDLARVEEVALRGRIPTNQKTLEVVPLEFILDGQGEIKNPLGMTGSRLEMRANVVSVLTPNYDNLKRVISSLNPEVNLEQMTPSVMAAARAVLTERQRENGVAVVDIGAATTGVAIYEDNDLQYIGVVPVGSNNITNDLAVMLAIDTEIAEEIKRRFVTGNFGAVESPVVIRWRGKELHFDRRRIDEVVRERLEDILSMVRKEIKKAHYDQRLPEGVVLTGGGAKMRDIDKFVRETLETSVKIGAPTGLVGVGEAVQRPEFATAVGLMLLSAERGGGKAKRSGKTKKRDSEGFFGRLFGKIKF